MERKIFKHVFIKFKLFRISSPKFSLAFRRSLLPFLTPAVIIYYYNYALIKKIDFFHFSTVKIRKRFKK